MGPAVDEAPEVERPPAAEAREASPESTPKRQEMHNRAERVSVTPTLVNDAEDEPQYQDAEVDFLPDTEWRAFERDHSPLSDDEGEGGEVGGEEVADDLHVEHPEATAPRTDERQAGNIVDECIEANFGEMPPSPEKPSPEEASATLLEPPLLNDTAFDSAHLSSQAAVSKTKVGRICLRLPLLPVIVKIEPVELGEVAPGESPEEEEVIAGDGVVPEEAGLEEVASQSQAEDDLVRVESSEREEDVAEEEAICRQEASFGEDAGHSQEEAIAEMGSAVIIRDVHEQGESTTQSEPLPSPPTAQIALATSQDTTAVGLVEANDNPRANNATPALEQQTPISAPSAATVAAAPQNPLQFEKLESGPSPTPENADERPEAVSPLTATTASSTSVEAPSAQGASASFSSATVIQAGSPFHSKSVIEAAGSGDFVPSSPERVFRESVSSISVTSEDPRAAARAAALLKLVCLLPVALVLHH